MSENYPQPRWAMLYLTLPLTGALFWLIGQVQSPGTVRSLLFVGALLVVGGYVEAWRLANTVALLHHPLTGNDREPIYYVREVTGSTPSAPGRSIQAVFVTDSRSDHVSVPAQAGEPIPRPMELSHAETRQ